eukprot:6949714-Alexandrium_andersonii.AAC.1
MVFAGHGATDGAIVLHAAADEARTWEEAMEFTAQLNLDDACVRYMRSVPPHVVSAVIHCAHGWRRACMPSHAVTSSPQRHFV